MAVTPMNLWLLMAAISLCEISGTDVVNAQGGIGYFMLKRCAGGDSFSP
jgi:hypothetical protein